MVIDSPKRILLAVLLACVVGCPSASSARQNPPAPEPAAHQNAARDYFTDVELVDQDGTTRRLYSDLIANRVVLITPFHTLCTATGPPMMANLRKLQDALGDRFGSQVTFVAITVDPNVDTTERRMAYARKFGARPGWHFLGGTKENVDVALRKLGLYVGDPDDHQTIFTIGNDRTGLWKKAFALAKPEELLAILESVIADEGP